MTGADPRAVTLALLGCRAEGQTICPSEVAKAMSAAVGNETADGWRGAMPTVHTVVDGLVAEGVVQLSWKGTPLTTRAGPYRIGRSTR